MGDFILVYTGEMNNEDITGKLVFFFAVQYQTVFMRIQIKHMIFLGNAGKG